MDITHDPQLLMMFGTIFAVLAFSTFVTWMINLHAKSEKVIALLANLNARMKAWWVMITIFATAISTGGNTSILLFALVSYAALREFVWLAPTREADHRSLAWVFFGVLPFNYYLIAAHWYGLFAVFVPVYAFIWIPIRSALSGDSKDFLARTAVIQWGLMICVYFVSYVPAILNLAIPGYQSQTARLVVFLVLVVQISDVLQYVFGKIFGKHKIAPNISPNKTVEGFLGGVISAVAVGTCFWWVTPFQPWQAGLMALVIGLTGFGGGMVMSAIKRDRGVKDYSALIPGHGGMMDRIDSLCFAAPVFFHLTRYFFAH